MIKTAWQLLFDYFPTPRLFLILGIPFLLLAFLYLFIAGVTKKKLSWRTGYSRKTFHFLVFITASLVQIQWALTGTILFGIAVSCVVFYAILKGDENLFYEAMAREKDAPKRTHYIIMPYLATLFGGIFSNILFTPFGAAFGYLATGFGDAVGEPIGTAFGKHRYKVPSLKGVASYRSYEGSFAVFIASCIAISLGFWLSQLPFESIVILKIIVVALGITLIEAISPHGWDNLTTQLVGSGLSFWLFIL